MKNLHGALALAFPLLFAPAAGGGARDAGPTAPPVSAPRPAGAAALPPLPLLLVENRGQADPSVAFHTSRRDLAAHFTAEGATWTLGPPGRRWAVRQHLAGAREGIVPRLLDPAPTLFSWFRGPRERWVRGARSYTSARWDEVWPGIAVEVAAEGDALKTRYLVSPGADPARIGLSYQGATAVTVTERGSLRVETPAGSFEDAAPVAWQEGPEGRVPVAAAYAVREAAPFGAAWAVTFLLGPHDPALPLVVDPTVLVYGGVFGGDHSDTLNAVAGGDDGSAYFAGSSRSTAASLPLAGGPVLARAGDEFDFHDAVVGKLLPDGAAFAYCGFVNGDSSDFAYDIAVDAGGWAHVVGATFSNEAHFPVHVGPDLTANFNGDAFVAKVSPDGTDLAYCGYLGGFGRDDGTAMTLDADGGILVAGQTMSESDTFPISFGHGFGIDDADAFVAKVKPDGSGLAWCRFLPTSRSIDSWPTFQYTARISDLLVDDQGRLLFCGTAPRPYQGSWGAMELLVGPSLAAPAGANTGFLGRLRLADLQLDFLGFVPTANDAAAVTVAQPSPGVVMVAGRVGAPPFGCTILQAPGAPSHSGGGGSALWTVGSAGTGFTGCLFLPGSHATCLAGAPDGNLVVGGIVPFFESDLPVFGAPQAAPGGGQDAFLAQVRMADSSLVYCTRIGGQGEESTGPASVAVDGEGFALLAGNVTGSVAGFPTAGSTPLAPGGGTEAFVVRVVPPFLLPDPPLRPEGLAVTQVAVDRIQLAWIDDGDSELAYELERKEEGGEFELHATLAGSAKTFTDADLPMLRTYSYRIRAIHEIGVSVYSDTVTGTTRGSVGLQVRKGQFKDTATPGKDSFRVSATAVLGAASPDLEFDPTADGLALRFGAAGATTELAIPAGDAGWKARKGAYAWKSARGALPRASLRVDFAKQRFSLVASGLDLAAPGDGTIRVEVVSGNDGGRVDAAWQAAPRNPGVLRYP